MCFNIQGKSNQFPPSGCGLWPIKTNFAAKMNTMLTIYLVRHGETEDNARQIMQGQTQGKLSAKGVRQVEILAGRLARIRFDAVWSSDLHRALETTRILTAGRDCHINETRLLRERDWGSFTGEYIPSLKGRPWTDDIETIEALRSRCEEFLAMAADKYADKTILVVGHGITNKIMQSVALGRPQNEIPRMENAEVRVLRIGKTTATAAFIGDDDSEEPW